MRMAVGSRPRWYAGLLLPSYRGTLELRPSWNCLQRIGTPLEDAERRDITINTLFYNVHTRSVEDWTGKVKPIRSSEACQELLADSGPDIENRRV